MAVCAQLAPVALTRSLPLSLTLTLTPRQQAGRWSGTLTRCIRAWCCVRRTGNRPQRRARVLLAVPVGGGGGHSLSRASWGSTGSFDPSLRLDEDGKVLTPEELLYRVSGVVGGAGVLGRQLGPPDNWALPGCAVCERDPRRRTRTNGRQAPVPHLRGAQVSISAHRGPATVQSEGW